MNRNLHLERLDGTLSPTRAETGLHYVQSVLILVKGHLVHKQNLQGTGQGVLTDTEDMLGA